MTPNLVGTELVVDASAILPLAVPEIGSEQALELISSVLANVACSLHAPNFVWIECGHALMKYVRRGALNESEATAIYLDLIKLPITLHDQVTLSPTEFQWALDNVVGSYDACYVSLARRLACPLVTMDMKLISKAGSHVTLLDLKQAVAFIRGAKQ